MSSTADVIAMSHFGEAVESKVTVLFPVTLSGVSSFGTAYEDLSFEPAWEVPRGNLIYSSSAPDLFMIN